MHFRLGIEPIFLFFNLVNLTTHSLILSHARAASCRSRFAPLVSRKGTAQAARAPAFCRRKKGGGKLPLPLRAPGLSERNSPSRPRPGFLQTQEERRQAAAPASRPWSLGRGQPMPPAPQLFADARRAVASCRSHFAPLVSWKGTDQAARASAFCRRKKGGGKLPLPLRAPVLSERDSPSRPRLSFLQTQEGRDLRPAPLA